MKGDFDQPLPGRDHASFDAPLERAPAPPPAAPPGQPATAPAPATGPQVMIGPNSSEGDLQRYTVPAESVELALKNGWKIEGQWSAEKHAADVDKLAEQHERTGHWEDYLSEGMGPLKSPGAYVPPETQAVATEADERYDEKHPVKSFAAKAANFGASIALGEGLGVGEAGKAVEAAVLKGAEQSLARKVAGSTAKVALESAAYSAPQAAVAAAYGDPERAAETMLWGTSLGGVLGGGGSLLGAGAKAAYRGATTGVAKKLGGLATHAQSIEDRVAAVKERNASWKPKRWTPALGDVEATEAPEAQDAIKLTGKKTGFIVDPDAGIRQETESLLDQGLGNELPQPLVLGNKQGRVGGKFVKGKPAMIDPGMLEGAELEPGGVGIRKTYEPQIKAGALTDKAPRGERAFGLGEVPAEPRPFAQRAATEPQIGNGLSQLDDISRNILGVTDAQAKKLGPERLARIVERADQEGLLAADPKRRPGLIKKMMDDAHEKIGEDLKQLEGLLGDDALRERGVSPAGVADDFSSALDEQIPDLHGELHTANATFAKKIENVIRAGGEEPSFVRLQAARNSLRSIKGDYDAKSVGGEIIRLADATLQRNMEEAAQRLFEGGGMPERFGNYLAQKERFEAAFQLSKNINEFKGTGRLPHGIGGPGLGDLARFGVHTAMGNPVTGALHVAGHHAVKSFTENKWGLLGKSVSFLRKAAADPATVPIIGGLMAKEGANALTAHIDALPAILSGSHVLARGDADVVSHFVGPTTGLTKEQQYDKLTATINRAATDQEGTAQRAGDDANTFMGTNVQLASLVAAKKMAALDYLHGQIPRDPSQPRPFERDAEWKATPQQQRDFIAKTEIVANPMTVWKHFQDGTMTKVDRDTMMAVYPKVYQEMVEKIAMTSADPRAPGLDRAKRAQLSTFTGQYMDASLKNLTAIQKAIQAQNQVQPQSTGPRPSSRPRLRTPGLETDTGRRSGGGHVR